MRIHGIRDKTFPSPVPQLKKNYKNGTLTKTRSRDEELAFAQTTSSLLLKSALRFLLFLQPLHSHRYGFIPYFVKVASDGNSSEILCLSTPVQFHKWQLSKLSTAVLTFKI